MLKNLLPSCLACATLAVERWHHSIGNPSGSIKISSWSHDLFVSLWWKPGCLKNSSQVTFWECFAMSDKIDTLGDYRLMIHNKTWLFTQQPASFNRNTSTVADMQSFLNKHRARLITFLMFVCWQCLIARNERKLFSTNHAVAHFYAAHCIDELSRGSILGPQNSHE